MQKMENTVLKLIELLPYGVRLVSKRYNKRYMNRRRERDEVQTSLDMQQCRNPELQVSINADFMNIDTQIAYIYNNKLK